MIRSARKIKSGDLSRTLKIQINKAEREGIEPTQDHNSPTTVLKTAATTRHASLSSTELVWKLERIFH
jgi:hypothetical protein